MINKLNLIKLSSIALFFLVPLLGISQADCSRTCEAQGPCGPSLIENGSFEVGIAGDARGVAFVGGGTGVSGWQTFGNVFLQNSPNNDCLPLLTEAAPGNGGRFIKIFGGFPGDGVMIGASVPAVEGETYCGSIEMYNPSFEDCANVQFNDHLAPGNPNFGILQIQFLDDAGNVICFAESDRFDSGNSNSSWQEVETIGVVPAGATQARLLVLFIQPGFDGGAIYFDDAQLSLKASEDANGVPFGSVPLACNDHVNASVNQDCELDVTADAFIEGDSDPLLTTVDIIGPTGQVLDLADVFEFANGSTLEFRVSNLCGDNYCWGTVTIEDKTDPTLNCNTCTDPTVSDPDCVLNCTEEKVFREFVDLGNGNGRLGLDEGLLESIIEYSENRNGFVRDFVTDNCFGVPIVADYSDSFSAIGDCSEGTMMTRLWSVTFPSVDGGNRTLNCTQYFRFDPIEVFDDMGNFTSIEAPHDTLAPGVFEPIIDETIEDMILMPKQVVELPSCDLGTSPAEIAAFFDNPATVDRDTDDDGIDPDEFDIDCVIESNEGIWFAYPHYYINGIRPEGPHAQPIMDGVCNIIVDFTDTELDACAPGCFGNSKTQRTWTIVDWCGSFAAEYTQIISVVDDLEPRLILESDQIFASTDPWQCAADVPIPAPKSLDDVCDADLTYYIGFVEGGLEVVGNAEDGFTVLGVPIGSRQVQYVAEDCCGNRAEVLATITVEDRTAPTPVTTQNLVVELGSINTTSPNQSPNDQGTAKIFVDAIDQGSFDNCTEVTVEIRRRDDDFCVQEDTEWGESVTFCCDDIDRAIDVEIRVCDKNDNCNILWSTVQVEDKVGGTGTCPPNLVLPCTADIWDLDLTGVPTSFGTCMQNPILVDTLETFAETEFRRKRANEGNPIGQFTGLDVPAYDPTCGFGAIRRFIIEAGSGDELCEQWFVLEPVDAFDPSTIVWPDDVTAVCEFVDTGEPTFLQPLCNLIGVDVERFEVEIEENSCMTILYDWTIVDWCTFDPSDPDAGGIFEWTQTVKILDDVSPEVTSDTGLCFGVDTDVCTRKGITLSATGTDEGECPSAWLSWTINVDYNADWVVDCVFQTNTSPTLSNGDPNPKWVAKTASGEPVTIVLDEELAGDKSQHRIEWIVDDGCGNRGSFETLFTVEDKKAPTPFCLNLGTAVMAPTDEFPQGMVELWAIDFDAKSFDNCSSEEDLFFTFTDVAPPPRCDAEYDSTTDLMWYNTTFWFFDSSEAVNVDPADDDGAECPENGFGAYSDGGFDRNTGVFEDFNGEEIHRWVPGRRSSGAIFTGDMVDASGFLQVPIYAWDECGNTDFCIVNVRIINNGGGAGRVAGQVRTEEEEMVQDVQTELISDIPGFPIQSLTNTEGSYAFENVLEDESYQITAEKNGDDGNGVNTIDLIIIQRHILGESRLETPYQMIAADINNDKRINGLDLIELRKFILGVYTEFPQNDSWRIIPDGQNLTIDNPWSYEEQIEVVSMTAEVLGQDFIATKIGDVNSTATVNGVSSTEVGKVTGLLFDDRPVLEGEEVEVVLSSTENVYGYQFTMDMTSMNLVSVEGQGIDASNVAQFEDKMTMSHGSIESMTGDLMTLTLKATADGQLGDLLGITSDITRAEAYIGEELEITNLRLENRSGLAYDLAQNTPNPFKVQTQITYTLPEAASATMTLYDVTGKVLQQLQLQGEKGVNVVTVDRETLTKGIVYYKLESGEYTATRHMIVIE